MQIKKYKSPTGYDIIGTAEVVPAIATIEGIDPVTGEAIYTGDTTLLWDKMKTVLGKRDQPVFVDSEGGRWSFHELKTADSLSRKRELVGAG